MKSVGLLNTTCDWLADITDPLVGIRVTWSI